MRKSFYHKNEEIFYTHKITQRSKCIRLIIKQGGEILVTSPKRMGSKKIDYFVRKNADWVLKNSEKMKQKKLNFLSQGAREDYLRLKEEAGIFAKQKIYYYEKFYGVRVNKISIKNQSSRWGSCSGKGNLNFNYRIVLIPEEWAEYIIAHEICHLLEFNHSEKFWALVEKTAPEYKRIRKELRKL